MMDIGNFNLFIKMIQDEYGLTSRQLDILGNRLLADDKEFEKIWKLYKTKNIRFKKGVDEFKSLLMELLS